jgi:ABC-type uncharacterized transport system permease subunit
MGMMAFIGASVSLRALRPAGLFILPVSFGLMVLGGILPCHPLGPSPVFKGWQLWGHVIGGGFSYGFALLAAAMGLFYLLKAKGKTGYPYDQLPDLEVLDRLNYRFVLASFVLATIMIHFAVLWAHMNLPNEFIKRAGSSVMILVWGYWMVYAVWLGMRWGLRWRGRKLALYSSFAVILMMVFTFYMAPFKEKSYHTGPFFPPYDAPEEMKPFLKNMESNVKPDKPIDNSDPVEVDKVAKIARHLKNQ